MGQLQQAVRFRTGHDIYNEGEVATFPREEAERLIAIGAASAWTGSMPQPNLEQEVIPTKKAGKAVKGVASTDVTGQAPGAGLGAQPAGQAASIFPPVVESEEEAKAREARDKAAESYSEEGTGGVDQYDGVRREMYGDAYAKAAAQGLVDPEKEVALRRPIPVATTPAGQARTPAQTKEDQKLEAARAKAAKKAGGKQGKKATKKGGQTASQVGRSAAAQGVGTGAQAGGKAANRARDTKTEFRNRGEGLGPASPKESNRNP
jgi:hypothetical protein